jgi:hypothetical protein
MKNLEWLKTWFSNNCDGDWEHENQIKIETVSNPGWDITIDLNYTPLEELTIENDVVDNGDDDWYFFDVKERRFHGGGDLSKLDFIISKFRELAEGRVYSL